MSEVSNKVKSGIFIIDTYHISSCYHKVFEVSPTSYNVGLCYLFEKGATIVPAPVSVFSFCCFWWNEQLRELFQRMFLTKGDSGHTLMPRSTSPFFSIQRPHLTRSLRFRDSSSVSISPNGFWISDSGKAPSTHPA